ncbi:MAG: 2-amino-4-hydroxy-6-hydroxymethyldihydropteridine diphosphokinase [Alistipes sp.]|nr:2-amino-4-hydroxy-6-hydroxymethyldihydropteridine diphosphokinase [Alistipes sp.]
MRERTNITSVVLLLGSNDIAAAEILRRAVEIIGLSVGKVVKCSDEHRSEAYGFTSDREFINLAVEVEVEADAYEVLRRINLIESLLGRDREEERRVQRERGEVYASRPIDIDIIFYGDASFSDERLTIPYHFLDEREYALRPVVDIAAERRHPALSRTPREMLEALTM